jgi:hypothetical protein
MEEGVGCPERRAMEVAVDSVLPPIRISTMSVSFSVLNDVNLRRQNLHENRMLLNKSNFSTDLNAQTINQK